MPAGHVTTTIARQGTSADIDLVDSIQSHRETVRRQIASGNVDRSYIDRQAAIWIQVPLRPSTQAPQRFPRGAPSGDCAVVAELVGAQR